MKRDNNKSSDIQDQAAEWVMKNDHGLTAAEQDAFTDWLSENEKHREAYASHRFAWAELARLAGLQNTDYAPVVPDLLGIDDAKWYQKIIKFPNWAAALSAAAIITLFIGYIFVGIPNQQGPVLDADQVLLANQIKQHQLEDGSVVELNKGAITETYITGVERLVKLISGEANFKVEKDPARPFIVEASGVRIRAVGTVFNVRIEDDKVDVVVTEGTVAVQHQQNEIDESMVSQNFRAVVHLESDNPGVLINPVKAADLGTELLWQPQLIDFEDAPLSQIVAEFNRRNSLQMELQNEAIGSLRFTSIFWSNNVESFVRLMETSYGITAEAISDNRILLKKSPDSL